MDFLTVEVLIEKILIYSVVVILIALTLYLYVRRLKRNSLLVEEKIKKSKRRRSS